MSSDYVVHDKRVEIVVIEQRQTMRYDLMVSAKIPDMPDTMYLTMNTQMTSEEYAEFIVNLARVYSYQHPGSETKTLAERIAKLA